MTTKIMLTNEQVQEYLKVILTSGKDFEDMFSIFQRLNYDDYKIAIFKLYNEEISLSEMNNSETINLNTNYIMRRLYIRDQLITLDFNHYKNENNIDEQLRIVSMILSDNEKQYLKNNISKLNLFGETFDESKYYLLLKNFVRISNYNNNHAYIETNSINDFSTDLNNQFLSDEQPLITIFGKLNKATLHN